MTEETAKRMHVVSAEDTPQTLKCCMDDAALPQFLGGSLQGKYITGEEITSTAWHDEADAYIAANAAKSPAFPWPPAATLVVAPRDVSTFTMDIAAGETARWEWDIEGYDISFKVLFTPQRSGDAVVVSEALCCEAGLARWIGEYTPVVQEGGCNGSGALELQWDNRSSVFRSKKIRYRAAAAVVEAEEAAMQ